VIARELVWADVVPAGTDLTALLMARLGAMGRVPPPQATHELDLALFIDPATFSAGGSADGLPVRRWSSGSLGSGSRAE
jgi:hypothetical protein